MSVTVPVGQSVAFVGQSGSGKTTIASLLERFYDVDNGRITVDGVDVREFNLSWWRNQIGFVSQEPVLFSGTVADNIRFGCDGATEDDVVQAAQAANAHEFIAKLPQGFNTPIATSVLSGGQKQRLAIARAILRKPSILIFDEATSALDVETERSVQQAIDSLLKGRTSIIIAHRLSTVRNANRIVVLREGKVIEQGSHDELLASQGAYFHMVESQRLGTGEAIREAKAATKGEHKKPEAKVAPAESKTASAAEAATEGPIPEVSLKRVLAYNKGSYGWLALGFVCASAHGALFALFPLILSDMVAALQSSNIHYEAKFYAVCFVLLGAAMFIANYGQNLGLKIASENMTFNLRRDSFRTILRQNMAFFDVPENSAGALVARLSVDAGQVHNLSNDRFGILIMSSSQVTAGLVICLYYGWTLTLACLACAPVLSVVFWLQLKLVKDSTQKGKAIADKAAQISGEAIANIRTVAAFGAQPTLLSSYSALMDKNKIIGFKAAVSAGLGFAMTQALVFMIYAFTFWFGAYLVGHSKMNFNDVMTVLTTLAFMAIGIGNASSMTPDIKKASLAADRIFKLIETVSTIDALEDTGKQLKLEHAASAGFENTTFAYPTRKAAVIFNGFSLQIPAGKTIAVVGPSGSGKSTLVQLLERFYDVDAGRVCVEGTDVRSAQLHSLRSLIGLVQQEPSLFSASIKDNICYGAPNATEAEFLAAAKLANVEEFVLGLKDKYNTLVGSKGVLLSGGQKQRVAIARAMLRKPKILLLDEATSALDRENEKLVQAAIDSMLAHHKAAVQTTKGEHVITISSSEPPVSSSPGWDHPTTTIVIAHRLSTIRSADWIVVLDAGRIVEQGTHEELLDRNAVYANLVRMQ